MKIATWNIERLKHIREKDEILRACEWARADILTLTETDVRVQPHYSYCFQTPLLEEILPDFYRPTENRVSVFTNYRCVRQHETYDKYTAICVELETERGNLLVYGTIMGIFGNRHASFQQDLALQMEDIRRLTAAGCGPVCVLGDYNLSFSDNYYFTQRGREAVQQTFSQNDIILLTQAEKECIDHIAVSKGFVIGADVQIEEWNYKRTLSDHKGILATLTWER